MAFIINIFKFIGTILDRILFTLCFLLGVQLPEFVQQYGQRLSGHLNEAISHLNQFQYIADAQYNGSLTTLIKHYQSNTDSAIQQTGQLVISLTNKIDQFEIEIMHLQQENYLSRIYYFITELNVEMAEATLRQFALAIPLQVQALLTGVIFAIIIIAIKFLIIHSAIFIYQKYTFKKIHKRSLI